MDVTSTLPGDGTDVAVLFEDLVVGSSADALRRWVAEGHTLIVAEPASELAPDAAYLDRSTGRLDRGRCDIVAPPGFAALSTLALNGPTAAFDPVDSLPGDVTGCFDDGDGPVVVSEAVGAGRIVSLGAPWFFTNDALALEDDAGLWAALAVPTSGTRLAVLVAGDQGEPIQAPDTGSLGDALPVGVGLAILQILVAFVVYALYRSRRLGRPVPEDPPVSIAGSELVRAVGGLLGHARAHDRAAASLRSSARRRLADRFGLPPQAGAELVVATLDARTAIPRTRLEAALLDAPVADDAALAALGRELDAVVVAALGGGPSTDLPTAAPDLEPFRPPPAGDQSPDGSS